MEGRLKEDGRTKITIYHKPTHTDQYLLMDSHYPLQQEDKVLEIEKIRKALEVCGYSHFAVANARNPPERQSSTSNPNKGSVVVPYVGGVTEGLRRVLGSRGVTVHFKPKNLLRSCLGLPKDQINKTEKCHTVYNLKCKNCLLHRRI